MLNNETMNKLRHMKLSVFIESLEQQENSADYREIDFNERFGLLVDCEFCKRQHNRIARLIAGAKFQNSSACIEDIDYAADRCLNRNFILELASCNYIAHAQNVLIVGATGAGKSYLAQALGQAACRRFISTRYIQLPELLDELKLARSKGTATFQQLRNKFAKYELLIIDEWLLFRIDEEGTQNILSLIDRRYNTHATIIVSQYEPAEWLDQIPVAVAAEAITDRLSSRAHKIVIQGKESMRLRIP